MYIFGNIKNVALAVVYKKLFRRVACLIHNGYLKELKGVFVKIERWYRLMTKNNRF